LSGSRHFRHDDLVNLLQRSSLLATLTALALAPAAHATSGSDIVGFVNAQRAASGFPAGIAEDAAASAACATWTVSPHPGGGSPLLPPSGSLTWFDGTGLGQIGSWTATHDPFEPYSGSLPLILAPRLATLGADESNGAGCVTPTDTSRPAPAQDVTYAYPGDGTTDALTSQTSDSPSGFYVDPATGDIANQGQTTGGVAYAFFDGPGFDPAHPAAARATSATLTGPDGADVPIWVRDATTQFSTASLPTEVQLVPKGELKPFSKYTASVAADVTLPGGGPTRSFSRTWSFTTGGLENRIQPTFMSHFGAIDPDPSSFTIELWSVAPNVTATATGPGTTATASDVRPSTPAGDRFVTLHLDQHGPWHICLSSGGAGTVYRAASACIDVVAGAAPRPPVLVVPQPVAKLKVSLAKGAKATWRGRVLTVSGVRCSAACTLKVSGTVRAGGTSYGFKSASVTRRSAGTATVKLALSKSAVARLRRARKARLALTIVPKGGRAVHTALAVRAAK
jgi:hypothetical protein